MSNNIENILADRERLKKENKKMKDIANKYDSLVEKIENKIGELKHKQIGASTGIYAIQVDVLEEILEKR